jgi:hypothetical protein
MRLSETCAIPPAAPSHDAFHTSPCRRGETPLELAVANNKKQKAAFELIFSNRSAHRTELVKCAMQLIDVELHTLTVIEQAQLQVLKRLG